MYPYDPNAVKDHGTSLSTGNYPALGFDPAPGAVAKVIAVAEDLDRVATELGNAYNDLTHIGQSDSFWQGDGADAFRDTVGKVPDYLDKGHHSLSDAASVLNRWSDDLTTMQRQAADLEARAEQAQAAVSQAQANPNLGLAGRTFADAAAAQQAQGALDAAKLGVDQANDALQQIIDDAKRLHTQHADLAQQVAAALVKAKNESPKKPGWLHHITDALGKMLKGIKNLASSAWGWVKDHADMIAKIGDVLSSVASVLGVVALATSWIPGVDAVTAAAAMGVSAAAAGTKLLAKAAGADVSWGSIAMDAVGVIPGGRMLGGAKNALKQAATAGKAAKFAEEGGSLAKVAGESKLAGKLAGLGDKGVALAGKSEVVESGTLSKVAGFGGKVEIKPTTFADLKADPKAAIENAAAYSHAKNVGLLNKIPRVDIDPFSHGGIAVGAGIGAAKGIAIKEAKDVAVDQVSGH